MGTALFLLMNGAVMVGYTSLALVSTKVKITRITKFFTIVFFTGGALNRFDVMRHALQGTVSDFGELHMLLFNGMQAIGVWGTIIGFFAHFVRRGSWPRSEWKTLVPRDEVDDRPSSEDVE